MTETPAESAVIEDVYECPVCGGSVTIDVAEHRVTVGGEDRTVRCNCNDIPMERVD